jgi:uncharacterized protein
MPRRPTDIADRDREWRQLTSLHEKPGPDLVFVLGRRRVGKSHLLARFSREAGGVYYQATKRTEADQLAQLSRAVGRHFDDASLVLGLGFGAWEDLFEYVASKAREQAVLLVLDEFPYLAGAAPALTSIIQQFWDHTWQDTNLKLVLSGSYITAMQRLEAADQPLYGRRTLKIFFEPFTVRDVGYFLPGYSARERMVVYGVAGNLPGHLALLDAQKTMGENLSALMLTPGGRLTDDAGHTLDAFLGEADVHYSLISAIANGDHTWSGITNRLGKPGGSILRPLHWLEEMRLVKRVVPITERNPAKSRNTLYRIQDPYLAFWHRVIAPLHRAGSIGLVDPAELWPDVEKRIDEHMGPVFEEICREFVGAAAPLPFQPIRVGEWWDATDQVDVVALGGGTHMLVGECKWGRVTTAHAAETRRRALQMAARIDGVEHVHVALFSGRGEFDDALREEADAGRLLLFGPEDIDGG